jgi:hypothetical protein
MSDWLGLMPRIPSRLSREVWPPSIARVTIAKVRTEAFTHPSQVKAHRVHEIRAKIYWERHARNYTNVIFDGDQM